MANRKTPNTPTRNSRKKPVRTGDFDNLIMQNNSDQEQDLRNALGYKKINLSGEISEGIKLRVKLLISSLQSLEKFSRYDSEEHADFYERNKEQIDSLLKIKLDELYQKLVTNTQKRKSYEEKLVQNKVITKEDFDLIRGVVSSEARTAFINEIAVTQRKTYEEFKKERDRINALPAPAPGAPANPPLPPEPILLNRDDLDNLNRALPDNFAQIIDRLQHEGKLNNDQVAKLTELAPKSAEQINQAKENIFIKIRQYDLANNSSYFSHYQEILREEEELAGQVDQYQESYNTMVKGLVEQIQSMVNHADYEKKRLKNLRSLRRKTGVPVKKGQILWAEDWSNEPTNFNLKRPHSNRLEITDITYGALEEDSDLLPDFKHKVPSFEPIIHFKATAQDGSGRTVDYQMSANTFRKWVITNNVIEKYDSHEDLEKQIAFPGAVQAGNSFEYFTYQYATPEQKDPLRDKNTVTIESVEGELITLDQEVTIDYAAPGTGLRESRTKRQLTRGEFAKWCRKNEAVPVIKSLESLNQYLAEHHHRLVTEMGWPSDHGAPISLSPQQQSLFLVSAYYPDGDFIEISKVENDQITLGDGSNMSHNDFLRFVESEGLTWPTADQLTELKQIAQARKDEKKAEKIEQITNNSPVAPSSKSAAESENSDGPVISYFKDLWSDRTFLNLMEMYELFIKAPFDRVEEWMKDKSERRQFKVGKQFYKGFPDFGGLSDLSTTYEDKLNGKIAGDIKGTEEFFDKNYDTAKVKEIMYECSDSSTLKACLQFLSKKGELRWEDDDKLHAVLDKVLKPAVYPSKFHQYVGADNISVHINDKAVLERAETMSIFDQIEIRLDNEYGEGTFGNLFSSNDKVYRDTREKTRGEMHKYEHMQGGIIVQLQKMLDDWEKGLPVDAATFDGLLVGGIAGEEFSPDQAILFLISAFGMPNPDGKTLLTFSKLNPYVKDLGDHLMYIYFAVGHDQRDENGNLIQIGEDDEGRPKYKRGKFITNNFKHIYNKVIKEDLKANGKSDYTRFEAGKNTMNWIQREVLTTAKVKERASNKAGNPNTGMQYYVHMGPLMSEENDIDKVVRTYAGSVNKPEILRTIYAGYNNQLAIKAKRLDEKDGATRALEFAQMVKGFFYFDDILRNRIKTNRDDYMRMSDSALDVPPGVDKKKKTIVFVKEVEEFTVKFTEGLISLSGDTLLKDLAQKTVLSGRPAYDDKIASDFRERLYAVILDQHKKDPKAVAALASSTSLVMKGMSGKQLSPEEIKALRGE
jgi:hypothetical protein